MAGASNSDDASEIFWPGYVDAVTNLAINLLFVIAVMAIVVITAILQISKMKPQDAATEVPKVQTKETSATEAQQALQQAKKAIAEARQSPQSTQQQVQQAMQQAEAALEKSTQSQQLLTDNVEQLQKKLQQLEKQAQAEQARMAKAQGKTPQASPQTQADNDSEGGTTLEVQQKAEVVQARQRTRSARQGKSDLQDLSAGGVIVVFEPDVIELTDAEAADLLRKLSASGPIKGSRWQLRVVSPKGFSEAARLGYYRLNTLRNVLIKHGAAPADIDMRVVEAEGSAANNARVLVRLMP